VPVGSSRSWWPPKTTTSRCGSTPTRSELGFDADFSSFVLGAFDTDSFFLLTVENWLDAGTPSSFGLLVDDVDARHARALELGAAEVRPPTDYGWKPRCSVVDDPSGNRIQLSQG
jgi:hypothetical protein